MMFSHLLVVFFPATFTVLPSTREPKPCSTSMLFFHQVVSATGSAYYSCFALHHLAKINGRWIYQNTMIFEECAAVVLLQSPTRLLMEYINV